MKHLIIGVIRHEEIQHRIAAALMVAGIKHTMIHMVDANAAIECGEQSLIFVEDEVMPAAEAFKLALAEMVKPLIIHDKPTGTDNKPFYMGLKKYQRRKQ